MKVFVAGGTGVLGRASLQALIAAGHSVRSTARGNDHAGLITKLGAERVAVDLFDPAAVRKAIATAATVGSMKQLRSTTAVQKSCEPR
jgi:uncharacterized protein YbjT (DUF2867 family)